MTLTYPQVGNCGVVYVIETNAWASRTVPLIAGMQAARAGELSVAPLQEL